MLDRVGLRAELDRVRLALELQVGGRWLLFLALDLVLVLQGVYVALAEPGDVYQRIWVLAFLVPLLGLEVPLLSDVVALERRAGCLDLALSVPASELYFVRRILTLEGFVFFQGLLLMLVTWIVSGGSFPLLPVLLQAGATVFVVGAVVLFWAVRSKEPGGVWLASLVTLSLLSPWLLANPVPTPYHAEGGAWLPGPWEGLSFLYRLVVLVASGIVLFTYARRRLRRPESLAG